MSAASAPAPAPLRSVSASADAEAAQQAYLQKAKVWEAKLASSAAKAARLFQHALALNAEDAASAEAASAKAASVRSSLFHDEKEEEERTEAAADAQMRRTELIQAILANYEKKAAKERVAALHWIMCRFHTDPELLEVDEKGLKTAFGRYAYLAAAVLGLLQDYAIAPAPPDVAKMQETLAALRERRQRLLRHLLHMARTGHELAVLAGVTKSYEAAIEAEVGYALLWAWHWLAQNPSASAEEAELHLGPYAPLAAAFTSVLA